MDDSGNDIFITQSSFCCLDDADTQAVDDAVENVLDTSLEVLNDLPTGDVVEYWDFSHDQKDGKTVNDRQHEAFVPLVPDLLQDEVCFIASHISIHFFTFFMNFLSYVLLNIHLFFL